MADRDRPELTVEQALEHILANVAVLSSERVSALDAIGRVLAEPVEADRDIPPLANSAMDGYAIRSADLSSLPARLQVIGEVAAGYVADIVVEEGQAVRIMTGASVPAGADTVVRFEDVRVVSEDVEVLRAPAAGANVRAAGEDVRAGQVVLRPGVLLRPQEIGMLAAVGKMTVGVVRRPRVAVLATGDEIVAPDELPGPGQIRDANSYTVAAEVRLAGGVPMILDIARDREDLVRRSLRVALEQGADFIVTSGGVSVGDFDLVKQVLAAEGEMVFWSVKIKPARPLAFGVIRARPGLLAQAIPLLGLPGNPVAALLSMKLFGRPALLKMQGVTDWAPPLLRARLEQPVLRKDGRRHFLRVRLRREGSDYAASLTGDQGSGILNSMVQADGLAIIPESIGHLPAGSEVDVIPMSFRMI